jgi:hypothetical protein
MTTTSKTALDYALLSLSTFVVPLHTSHGCSHCSYFIAPTSSPSSQGKQGDTGKRSNDGSDSGRVFSRGFRHGVSAALFKVALVLGAGGVTVYQGLVAVHWGGAASEKRCCNCDCHDLFHF